MSDLMNEVFKAIERALREKSDEADAALQRALSAWRASLERKP
jgi:hypothetical protein